MKSSLTFFFCIIWIVSIGQLNQKSVEKADGRYSYSYHKNGKESTVEFHSNSSQYMAQGYSKAFDKTGKLIYEATNSRSGQISGTRFTFYESGAVKTAEYSSHPDAGIQWYKKTTYFNEDGTISHVYEMSNDMHTTTFAIPDTVALKKEFDYVTSEKLKQKEKAEQVRQQFVKDSTLFYTPTTYVDSTNGYLVTLVPKPEEGAREFIWLNGKRKILSRTEFFQKNDGIKSIERTFYKNGGIAQEIIYENSVCHIRNYSKKGEMLSEKLNQNCTTSN